MKTSVPPRSISPHEYEQSQRIASFVEARKSKTPDSFFLEVDIRYLELAQTYLMAIPVGCDEEYVTDIYRDVTMLLWRLRRCQ